MKRILYYILQFTWGLPQNIMGLVLMLMNIRKRKEFFHGNLVTFWDHDSCLSLGIFLFVTEGIKDQAHLQFLRAHEAGHSLQSLILGPFYLFVIGIPSFVWANFTPIRKRRLNRGIGYYTFYTERWANRIFEHYIKDEH